MISLDMKNYNTILTQKLQKAAFFEGRKKRDYMVLKAKYFHKYQLKVKEAQIW